MTSFSPKQTLLPAGFEPFNLSMIQLGSIGPDKRVNLVHAREMVLKAAAPPDKENDKGKGGKSQLVCLPVSPVR
jgi:hypothetical protein